MKTTLTCLSSSEYGNCCQAAKLEPPKKGGIVHLKALEKLEIIEEEFQMHGAGPANEWNKS